MPNDLSLEQWAILDKVREFQVYVDHMQNEHRRPNWHQYALMLANTVRVRSEDPWVKVGAVILRSDNSVAAVGYNGAPSGVTIDWSDRDGRRKRVIHAEANALRFVRPGEGALMATTMISCIECLKLTASHGIKEVIYLEDYSSAVYDARETFEIAAQFGISLTKVHIE